MKTGALIMTAATGLFLAGCGGAAKVKKKMHSVGKEGRPNHLLEADDHNDPSPADSSEDRLRHSRCCAFGVCPVSWSRRQAVSADGSVLVGDSST